MCQFKSLLPGQQQCELPLRRARECRPDLIPGIWYQVVVFVGTAINTNDVHSQEVSGDVSSAPAPVIEVGVVVEVGFSIETVVQRVVDRAGHRALRDYTSKNEILKQSRLLYLKKNVFRLQRKRSSSLTIIQVLR